MLSSKMSHLTHLCGKEAVLASKPKRSRMNPSPPLCWNLPLFPSVTTYISLPSPLQPNMQGHPLKIGLQVSLLVPIPLQFSDRSLERPAQTERTKEGDGLALMLLEEAVVPPSPTLGHSLPQDQPRWDADTVMYFSCWLWTSWKAKRQQSSHKLRLTRTGIIRHSASTK